MQHACWTDCRLNSPVVVCVHVCICMYVCVWFMLLGYAEYFISLMSMECGRALPYGVWCIPRTVGGVLSPVYWDIELLSLPQFSSGAAASLRMEIAWCTSWALYFVRCMCCHHYPHHHPHNHPSSSSPSPSSLLFSCPSPRIIILILILTLTLSTIPASIFTQVCLHHRAHNS